MKTENIYTEVSDPNQILIWSAFCLVMSLVIFMAYYGLRGWLL